MRVASSSSSCSTTAPGQRRGGRRRPYALPRLPPERAPIFRARRGTRPAPSAAGYRTPGCNRPRFQGLPGVTAIDVPGRIDAATARANRLGVAQRLCGRLRPLHPTGIDCRAQALLHAAPAADRHRGAGRARGCHEPPGRSAARQLAGALAGRPVILDPQIPNRQPFAGIEADCPRAMPAVRYADIPAVFDPLMLRAPIEHWRDATRAT